MAYRKKTPRYELAVIATPEAPRRSPTPSKYRGIVALKPGQSMVVPLGLVPSHPHDRIATLRATAYYYSKLLGRTYRARIISHKTAIIARLACFAATLMMSPANAQQHCGHKHQPPCPPPPPTLTLSFAPQMPSIPQTTPLGTIVATATAAWSDGSPFTGNLSFGAPYGDDGGTFALSCMQCASANIIVNPLGLGVSGDGGTIQNITIVATQ